MMAKLIDEYFSKHLGLSEADAIRLHEEYYKNYGLAIEGLVRFHQIDPLEYNAKVDDALPLEGIIKPNPQLRKMLEDIDKSKVKLWLLTNAYVNHAKRVVRLLGIEDLVEGLTYCNYSEVPFLCKPHPDMYAKAMQEAGVERPEDCYFVGTYPKPIESLPRCMATHFRQTIPTEIALLRRNSVGQQPTWWKRAYKHHQHQLRNIRLSTWKSCELSTHSSSNHQSSIKLCGTIHLEGMHQEGHIGKENLHGTRSIQSIQKGKKELEWGITECHVKHC